METKLELGWHLNNLEKIFQMFFFFTWLLPLIEIVAVVTKSLTWATHAGEPKLKKKKKNDEFLRLSTDSSKKKETDIRGGRVLFFPKKENGRCRVKANSSIKVTTGARQRGLNNSLKSGNKEKATRFPLFWLRPLFSQSAPFSDEKVNWFNEFLFSKYWQCQLDDDWRLHVTRSKVNF